YQSGLYSDQRSLCPVGAKNKLAFIEIARVLCIFLVVLLHSVDMVTGKYGYTSVTILISTVTRFVVPVFFTISAFLLAIRHRNPNYSIDTNKFWRSRLQTLVLPFLVWNVIYMLVEKDLWDVPILSPSTAFNLATGYIQLFFIFVLLQCLAVYSIIANRFTEKLVRNCLILFVLASIAFYGLSSYLLWTQGSDGHFFEWTYGKLIFPWGIFFFWGIWLGYKPQGIVRISRYRFIFLATAIIALIPYLWGTKLQLLVLGGISRDYFLITGLPFQFLAATAFLGFLYPLELSIQSNKTALALAGWGKYMFGVYVAHLALQYYIDQWWNQLFPEAEAFWQITIETFLAFFLTLAFVRLCSEPKLSLLNRVLFGGRGT
ncbi:MAG: acyltransferase, partial [Methanotrichaceae archaeon]|nr:acyltransferase [Methanotrichaceae archaeon]